MRPCLLPLSLALALVAGCAGKSPASPQTPGATTTQAKPTVASYKDAAPIAGVVLAPDRIA